MAELELHLSNMPSLQTDTEMGDKSCTEKKYIMS